MSFDFASVKANARRVVHDTLAVSAIYQADSVSVAQPIRARVHNKLALTGDPENTGYAEMMDGTYRIVLVPQDTPSITFESNGLITLVDLDGVAYDGPYVLLAREPQSGPLEQIWRASRP